MPAPRSYNVMSGRDSTDTPRDLLTDEDGKMQMAGYEPNGRKMLVGTARDRFFENFNTFNTSPTGDWELVQTGAGMAITGPLGGNAAGAGPYINIASGTTAASKTIILSRDTFSMPLDLRYQISASQRIANNHLIIGFVQVDDAGAIVTDTTFSTADEALNARNAVYHKHDGVTATTAQLRVRAGGSALDTLANAFGTGFTTVATGTGPNFIAATNFGIMLERDRISARSWGQNILTNTGGQFAYDRLLVNPNRSYKLAIIVENAAAPATSTDWRLHLINILDATRFDVAPRSAGTTDLAKAFPVQGTVLIGSGTVAAAGTVAVDAAIGNPVTAGLRASNANIAAMSAAGDSVGWLGTMIGAGIVKPYALPEAGFNASLALTSTTAAAIQTAGAAGIKRHLTAVQAINTGAAAVDLIILDGTTERWRLPLPVNIPVAFAFPTEIVTTTATALNANLSAAGTVRANFQGYTAP